MSHAEHRRALGTVMRALAAAGLNQGAAGNASVRVSEGMLITPTGMKPALLQDDSHVLMSLDGAPAKRRVRKQRILLM